MLTWLGTGSFSMKSVNASCTRRLSQGRRLSTSTMTVAYQIGMHSGSTLSAANLASRVSGASWANLVQSVANALGLGTVTISNLRTITAPTVATPPTDTSFATKLTSWTLSAGVILLSVMIP